MPEQVCILKIKYQHDLPKLVESLTNSGYTVEISPIFHKYPRENDIKLYEVIISGMVGEGE